MFALKSIPLSKIKIDSKRCKQIIFKICRKKLGYGIPVKIISEELILYGNELRLRIKYHVFVGDGVGDNGVVERVLDHALCMMLNDGAKDDTKSMLGE